MNTPYIAEALSYGGRGGTVRSPDLALNQTLGRPELAAHPAPSVTPELLFAGAYAACFHQAVLNTAIGQNISLRDSTVRARVSLILDVGAEQRLSVNLYAVLPGLDPAQASHLLNDAHAVCVYSKALRGNALVTISSNAP